MRSAFSYTWENVKGCGKEGKFVYWAYYDKTTIASASTARSYFSHRLRGGTGVSSFGVARAMDWCGGFGIANQSGT